MKKPAAIALESLNVRPKTVNATRQVLIVQKNAPAQLCVQTNKDYFNLHLCFIIANIGSLRVVLQSLTFLRVVTGVGGKRMGMCAATVKQLRLCA